MGKYFYSLSFKLAVIQEIESGLISIGEAQHKYGIKGKDTIRQWQIKYGVFNNYHSPTVKYMKALHIKILKLEQKIKLLEKENQHLEIRLSESEDKTLILK